MSETEFIDDCTRRYGEPLRRDDEGLSGASDYILSALKGEPTPYDGPIDFQEGTPFQRRVWKILQTIPCDETRSYKWLAERAGSPKAARAVGQATGKNPVSIIVPCHRIILSDGGIGGYGGGIDTKIALLLAEGVMVP
jgi:methylated-DNA-[protein]-cysteine S-methyltransferase